MHYEFGSDILDLRDVLTNRRLLLKGNLDDVEFWDEEDQEYLAMVSELEDQLWTSLTAYIDHESTLILDSYFEEYARQVASDIHGIDEDMEWPFNRLDWAEAAEDLKQDYTEFSIGPYTYYGRS
jgi:hypothetical protein